MAELDLTLIGCRGGWKKYKENPVLGENNDFRFDVHVLKVGDLFRMYFSWRKHYSIAVTESPDGVHWSEPKLVLQPRPETGWEDDVNRPTVVYKDGMYHMWYSGQTAGREFSTTDWTQVYVEAASNDKGTSDIGYALSRDGFTWERRDEPVLRPTQEWEKSSLMCPTVLWDESEGRYTMWYSGGGWFEPDSLGVATSKDGMDWERPLDSPIFTAEPMNIWERERVAGAHVVHHEDWYYLFYIGYEDIFKARICIARSRDGFSSWERHPQNPILSAGVPGGWDSESIYKPFAMYDEMDDRWTMWFNARTGTTEQIGVAYHDGADLGFDS